VALSYARLNQSSFGASRMNMSRDVWYLFTLQCPKFLYVRHTVLYLSFIFTFIFAYIYLFWIFRDNFQFWMYILRTGMLNNCHAQSRVSHVTCHYKNNIKDLSSWWFYHSAFGKHATIQRVLSDFGNTISIWRCM
jgi:hypothetical protein